MANINKINLDTSLMVASATSRSVVFNGDIGAKFILMVINTNVSASNQHQYYDFKSQTFENGHNDLNNNLVIEMDTNNVSVVINFPSGAGTYIFKMIAFDGTTLLNKNAHSIQVSKQSSNASLVFAPISLGSSDNYTTQPTLTSTGAPGDTNKVNFSFDVTNTSSDAKGFGLKLINDTFILNAKYWYFGTTENVFDNPAGDAKDSTTVEVADLSDLGVGSELIYHKGTTAPTNEAGDSLTNVRIISLDLLNNTITFNQAVAFEDGETMTFRAYGKKAISTATGVTLDFGAIDVVPTILTKTIRAGSSGTTINLNGTYGIAGGNTVTITGLNIDNSSANAVTSVSASSSAGSIVVQNSQSGLETGSTLTFSGCHQVINISGGIKINNYPTANKNIYLDLDRFITAGAAS